MNSSSDGVYVIFVLFAAAGVLITLVTGQWLHWVPAVVAYARGARAACGKK